MWVWAIKRPPEDGRRKDVVVFMLVCQGSLLKNVCVYV